MSSVTRLAPGEVVGGYVVESLLRRGGVGEVYVARDLRSGAQVALKVLAAASAGESARFERECRVAERLVHPGIAAGLGHGRRDDGLAWLAMELLRGEDLSARLERGPLAMADVLSLGAQVCDALDYAHALGVVHRDIKPSNLFLCEGPSLRVKLLDFGVARLLDDGRLTRTGLPVGTYAYMAPEQTRGARDLDARADLWSLGVVLYECASGRRPFVAHSGIGYVFQIREATPPSLAVAAPGAPRGLVEVVQRALSRPREARFPSAAAMRAALAVVESRAPSTSSAAPAESSRPSIDATVTHDAEVRLASVVVVRGARDAVFLDGLARELGGRVEPLVDDTYLGLFGVDQWIGDEPVRAARFAVAVASSARSVGVATGRVLRSTESVEGSAVDSAAALARVDGVLVDPATAETVRGEFTLGPREGDGARITARDDTGASKGAAEFATAFVGRDVDLALLRQCVDLAAQQGRAHAVIVLGAAGIGKSRLCHEAVAALRARSPDATALVTRCEMTARDTPFAALVDALAGAVDPGVTRLLAPLSAAGVDPVVALDRARQCLETVLAGIAARGPLALAFDDGQWLDPSTRAALRWILQDASDIPMAVWAFGRPEAREALVDALPGAAVIDLGALGRDDARALLVAVTGDAPDEVLARAGGNPLFLEALGRLPVAGGSVHELPLSIEGAHLAQLDLVDPSEREFLKRAAVSGRTSWVEAVVDLGGDELAAPRLRREGFLVTRAKSRFAGTRELAFRSGTLQEVAYGLWPDPSRRDLHARMARWLSARESVTPEELARHYALAEMRDLAAGCYADAAERAARVADAVAARSHAERALALDPDARTRWRALAARDDALQLGDDLTTQREGVAELVALASTLDLRHRVEAAWRACYLARVTADVDVARASGARALALADELGEPRWRATANIELALMHGNSGRHDVAATHAAAARALAAQTGDGWLVARADATQAYVRAETADPVAVQALFEAAAEGFARAGDRRREALMRANAGAAMLLSGRLDEAAEAFTAAADAARKVGNAPTVAVATHNLGVVRRAQGDLAAAEALQSRAEAVGVRLTHARLLSSVATERVWLARASHADPASLRAACDEATRRAEAARSPALRAAAMAATMGVTASDEVLVAARALLATLPGEEARAALAVAVSAAGGGRTDDAAAAIAALEALVRRLADPDDRARCLEAFARRYEVPAALAWRVVTAGA